MYLVDILQWLETKVILSMQRLKHGQQVLDESLLVFITLLEKKAFVPVQNPHLYR
jgi:hypothetical protein